MPKLLTQNAKIKKSSGSGFRVYNFGIPALKSKGGKSTCPNAGLCATGCYARQGAYVWNNVNAAYEWRLEQTMRTDFSQLMTVEVAHLTKKPGRVFIRIHDSGDFYDAAYFQKWRVVMERFPHVEFYAYTKQVEMFQSVELPKNFTLIFSQGGKQDALINTTTMRHSRVFESKAELEQAGYIDASQNDLLALTPNHRVGLVYHGAKRYNNTAWQHVA